MGVAGSGRWLAVALAMTVVAGCTSEDAPSAQDGADTVRFTSRGGDVFAPFIRVAGEATCDRVTVAVNGSDVAEVGASEVFSARVPLEPGTNEVTARCGDVVAAPVVFEQRLEIAPTARIDVSIEDGTVVLDGSASEGVDGDSVELTWRPDADHPADLRLAKGGTLKTESGARLDLATPAADGEYHVALEARDPQGRTDVARTYFAVENGTARVVDMDHEHPSWMDRAVVYAPIPKLWGNNWPKALKEKLPYLKELGVDALWLWPPVTARTPGEEYAIDDYFELDPEWGPEEDFREAIDEAHRLGFKVLADFVPNHLSAESPYYKDTVEHGEESRYWDFFDRDENGEPTHYFDWEHLPNLNFENPEVRRMVLQSMRYWVRDMDLDGFRVDVAWGIKRRRPDFWMPWRREMKRVKPDVMLIAEASAVDPYYFANGFDIGYDWSHDLGQWAWASIWKFPEEAGALLEGALTDGGTGYPKDAVILRFINNNDTGIRFVDQYGPEMTRVAATLQFTVPGVPAMFGGDEIGASYEPYSNLTPMPWRDRFNLRDFYKHLIDLKHELVGLEGREMHIMRTESNANFSYLRPAADPTDSLLVVLNFADKARVEIPMNAQLAAFLDANPVLRDHLTGEVVQVTRSENHLSLQMDAVSSLVLGGGR